jgi:protein ImuA
LDVSSQVEGLRREIRRLEGGYGDAGLRRHVGTGIPALDAALPGRGLPAGAIVEVVGTSWPPWTAAVLLARGALAAGETEAVLIDTAREVYPPALAALGLDLERTTIVRPRSEREAAWAFAEALAESRDAIVVGALARVGAADARRLQLSAEAQGGIGLLLRVEAAAGRPRPAPRRCGPAGASVRLRVAPCAGRGEVERFSVEVARCRGGAAGEGAVVEMDRATLSIACAPLL